MCRRAMVLGLRRIRIKHTGCRERSLTMVVYPDGIWYRYECEADIDAILHEHIVHGPRGAPASRDRPDDPARLEAHFRHFASVEV